MADITHRPSVKAWKTELGHSLVALPWYRRFGAPRLDQLIAHLEEVGRRDPECFNLDTWFTESPEVAAREWLERWATGRELNCGTTACLVGHLPLVFPAVFKWRRLSDRNGEVICMHCPESTRTVSYLESFFRVSRWFWLAAIFPRDGFWSHQHGPDKVPVESMVGLLRDLRQVCDLEVGHPASI